MKKIILILFLFLSCYIIYNLTEDKTKNYLLLGDSIADIPQIKAKFDYNNYYINNDYRIVDLLKTIQHNEELEKNNKNISIHRLLKNSDILILSVGMNDIYYKINTDIKNIYTYLNTMIQNMDSLLKEINKYNYDKVYILGYYNTKENYNDIFTYINYKIEKLSKEYKYEYIKLNHILSRTPNFYINSNNYALNNAGYNEISKIIVEK